MILVVMVFSVMCVVGAILIGSVVDFYKKDFADQMRENLSPGTQLRDELTSAMTKDDFYEAQKKILISYGSSLGIDEYRDYYILDTDGMLLAGSNPELGLSLAKTTNMLLAMNGEDGYNITEGSDFSDAAIYLENNGYKCIIYIKDTQDEARELTWILFSIVIQSLFIGLLIAIILSFFLAKAISSPIQNLTRGTQLVAEGDFTHNIETHSRDEIGILTDNFNHMKTVLKNTLDEVSGERQKLETVLSYLTDPVITFSNDGLILHINESGIRLLGDEYNESFNIYKFFELFGVPYEGDKLDIDNFRPPAIRTADGGVLIRALIYKDHVLDVSFGMIRYNDKSEIKRGFITVIHDITESYELDKARREFVANVSHELRTPLTSIKGACETILEDEDMPDDVRRHFLAMVVSESDRMTRIVTDLLVLSRLENNRTKWRIESFDIKDAIRHLCELMRVDAKSHNHTLRFSASKYIPKITGDRERIEQVLINVLSNSIKYTPDGGEINLIALYQKNSDYITIQVTDNGIGIPEEDLAHIFERFYRVEKSRTSETGGTGLGLAIAREIVIAHGGDISIDSKYGSGTTVTIKLPIKTKLSSSKSISREEGGAVV